MEQHIRYIREEEGVRIYNSLLTDITKIKRQEDELLESQRLLHHLLGIADQRDSPRQLTKRNKEHAAKLYAESFPRGKRHMKMHNSYYFYVQLSRQSMIIRIYFVFLSQQRKTITD